MKKYAMFFGFTQQGIEKIKESPARVAAAKKIVQSMGGKVTDFYGLMGMTSFDTLFIIEAPDDDVVAKSALAIASKGNVRTTTVRAFTEDEFKQVIDKLV